MQRAAAVMGTPLNRELLVADGLLPAQVEASPDDLVVAVVAENDELAEHVLESIDDLVRARSEVDGPASAAQALTIAAALKQAPADIAVIAVPGAHAAAEAFAALREGLHVFLFSDNVALRDEVRLKRFAAERDLLMMGPDCGTAILGGIGLGFANRVARGPVGIVGASGTGIQQVCCLLDDAGIGVAAAIGTGSRDLSAAVGGSMTRRTIAAFKTDKTIEIVVVISKPADERAAQRLHKDLLKLRKPSVVCLLGADMDDEGPVHYARDLTDAARLVADIAGKPFALPVENGTGAAAAPAGSRVYGLFAGGTLRTEAAQTLDGMGVSNTLLDLGDDEYTRGRAHPMIDPRLRASLLAQLGHNDDLGAVLLDVLLGDLSHDDPAGAIVTAIQTLQAAASDAPPIYVSLIGTRNDIQGLAEQRAKLQACGAHVFASNVAAAQAAGRAIGASR